MDLRPDVMTPEYRFVLASKLDQAAESGDAALVSGTRTALLTSLWDGRHGGSRTVDVHVHRLRSKLGERTGLALQTVRGVGYRWSPRAARSA